MYIIFFNSIIIGTKEDMHASTKSATFIYIYIYIIVKRNRLWKDEQKFQKLKKPKAKEEETKAQDSIYMHPKIDRLRNAFL